MTVAASQGTVSTLLSLATSTIMQPAVPCQRQAAGRLLITGRRLEWSHVLLTWQVTGVRLQFASFMPHLEGYAGPSLPLTSHWLLS